MSTIREQLIESDVAILESTSLIKKVRRTMPEFEDLKRYASTQFPIAAVTAGLPEPQSYHTSRRSAGDIDQITSRLTVEANVYFIQADIEQVDSDLSALSSPLFALLFENQTRDDLCQSTIVELNPKTGHWKPYGAFKILVNHTYVHSIGGI